MTKEKKDGRKSPENIERLKSMGFQKGQPRHPDAGRQKTPEALKTRFAEMAPEMVEQLYYLAFNADKDSVKLAAIQTVLGPLIAKAPKEIKVQHNHSVSDLLQRVNSRRNNDQGMIDITPEDGSE